MSDHFVGRDAELDTLDELLVQARAGAPHVVVLVGEPGIGKTTLIDGFLRRHRDVTSLRAGGDHLEMLYSYGIVRQLAASAGPAGLELAGQLAQVAPVPDPIAIGSQLLALLGERQQAGPAVLVIDDIQWADDPSVKSITFGLRRLQADQLLVILAVREESIDELPDGLLRIVRGELATEIRLGGWPSTNWPSWPESSASAAFRLGRPGGCDRARTGIRCSPASCSGSSRPNPGEHRTSCRRPGRSGTWSGNVTGGAAPTGAGWWTRRPSSACPPRWP